MEPHEDTGYSWLIALLSSISNMLIYGVINTVGVFHTIFMENIDNSGSAQVALITSLTVSISSGVGMASGLLACSFGCRITAMIGGVVACLGMLLSSLAQSVYHLYITFGVITGVGLGLHTMPTLSVVGIYFHKYRSTAFGISTAGIGLGAFTLPPVITYLEEEYGWRGALLILGGVLLNLTVLGALYRPVQTKNQTQPPRSLHLHIFKNKAYVVLIIQCCIVWLANTILFVHLAAYVRYLGYTNRQAAVAVSVMGISNCIGRLIWGGMNQIPSITPITLYFGCYMIQGILTVLVPLLSDYTWVVVYSGVFGLLSGSYGTSMPQLVVEVLGVDLIGVGIGYQFTIAAIACLIGGLLAGFLLDVTGLYSPSFYLAGTCFIVGSLVLLIPWRLTKTSKETTGTAHSMEIDKDLQINCRKNELKCDPELNGTSTTA